MNKLAELNTGSDLHMWYFVRESPSFTLEMN